jgi:hypothetical protein
VNNHGRILGYLSDGARKPLYVLTPIAPNASQPAQ